MATDVSTTTTRGLLIGEERLGSASLNAGLSSTDANRSSASQAGPRPGIPDPQTDSEMVLETSGTQSANTRIEVRALKAGVPTPDEGSHVWRGSGDTYWRGWEPPCTISGFEFLDLTSTASRWKHPTAVTLADSSIVVVVQKSNRYVQCWKRAVATGTWSNVEVYDNGGTYTHTARPCLAVLPSGRILCWFWVEDTATSNQVRMYYSDDDAATWTLGSRSCLRDALNTGTYTPGRLRAAYLGGQVLLVAGAVAALPYDDIFVQYASSDMGASFSTVDTWSGADSNTSGKYHDLLVVNGAFMFFYLKEASGAPVPRYRTIANAFSLLSVATAVEAYDDSAPIEWGVIAAGVFSNGDLATWQDEDGILYLAGRDHGGGSFLECYTIRSIDGGVTWGTMGGSASSGGVSAWWQGRDVAVYPRDFCAVAQGGRAVLIHEFETNYAVTNDDSLCATYLGGWTTVCLPAFYTAIRPDQRVAWERTWLPFDLPEGGYYTAVDVGAPVVAITSGGANITGGLGDTRTWSLTTAPTSTLAQGIITELPVKVVAGSAFLIVRVANATPVSYSIQVTVTPTSITLRDTVAGANVGTAETTTAGATGVELRVALGQDSGTGNTGNVYAWWRPAATGCGTDREWDLIGSVGFSTALQAGASFNNHIQFGNSSAVATDVSFRKHCVTYGAYAGNQLFLGQSNPTELLGRNFSTTGGFIDEGLRLIAKDGPVFQGDLWYIDTEYDYPLTNIFPDSEPSPDTTWRSTTDAAEQTIVLCLDETMAQEMSLRGPMAGLYLGNINWKIGYLEGWRLAGPAWEAIGTVDASTGGTPLKFERLGSSVVVSSSTTTGATYWTQNILAGSTFRMAAGKVRRIARNTGGAWNNAVTMRSRLVLDDAVAADTLSGSVGEVWSKDVTLICNNATQYTRFRLRIPAQDTPDGFFQIGVMQLGHVAVFGRQYSRGRALTLAPNTELTTARSGTRRSRVLGKSRRGVEFGWVEGVPTRPIAATTPAPNYLLAFTTSTDPVATPADTPYLISGLVEELDGSDVPVVYLPKIPKQATSTAFCIANRQLQLYSRVTSAVRLEGHPTARGDEWSTECLTVSTIVLEEEL